MFSSLADSPLLETIICLILVFALLSLLVSTITEIINSYFNERGRQLYKTVSRLFSDGINPNFGQLMYNHPMIANLRKDLSSLPQYISNPMFSQVMIDTIGNFARIYKYSPEAKAILMVEGSTDPFERFREGVQKMAHTDLKLLLLNMVEKSDSMANATAGKLFLLDQQLQLWYKDQMDRASGWFKDLMRARLRWVAFAVALALNVNSIFLFKTLYTSPILRNKLLPVAEQVADNYSKLLADTTLTGQQRALRATAESQLKKANTDTAFGQVSKLLTQIRAIDSLAYRQDTQRLSQYQHVNDLLAETAGLGLPLGWHKGVPPFRRQTDPAGFWGGVGWWLFYWLGILITAFSISVGAPFWFDWLLKFVNIRRAGKKPED